MSTKNKEIFKKADAAFAEGSIDGFLSFCADDIVWTIVGDRTVKGKNAIREWMASMDMEPPTFTVHNVIAEGDLLTSNGDMTMKDKQGKVVPYSYCDIYKFRDEKIVELTSFVVRTEAKSEASSGA